MSETVTDSIEVQGCLYHLFLGKDSLLMGLRA